MSIPSQQPGTKETIRMSGSLAGWLRRCLTERKTMAVLASSAIAATVVAMYRPAGSLLSASQFGPSDGSVQGGELMPGASSGFEIIPRGRDGAGRWVSVRRQASTSTAFGQSSAAETSFGGRRAVLHKPVFSDLPVEAPQPAVPKKDELSQQPHQQPSQPTQQPNVSFGHSGFANRPVGYHYVDAAEIRSLPYAGNSTGSVNVTTVTAANSSTTLEISQLAPSRPSTPVPAVPFGTPVLSNDASQAKPLDPSADSGSRLFFPHHTGPQIISQPQTSPSYGHSFSAPAPGTSGFRATVEADAPGWLDPYRNRTGLQPEGTEPTPAPVPSVIMPPGYSAWWDSLVQQRAGIAPRAMPVDVTSLVQQALLYSPQVQVLQADPEVQQRVVRQEEAIFDWRAFLDARYDDLNDPVGNVLTTGNNSNRFVNNVVNSQGGLKRRTETGGEFKVSQQVGHQYNNSRFLLPNPQSTSRLELSFRQPLLSRAGTVYNQNQIVLARINANSTGDETLQELQAHLYNVAEVYWKLYRARAEFFQRQKLLASAQKVLSKLDGRNEVDTIPRQILRARAAVARAESRMQRAVTDIRNAESQLRLLVNDPAMLNSGPIEFTPTEMPATIPSPTGLRESLQEALINRPDISQAIRQMRASGVRLGVSKSEMLPKLDFIVTSYVAGLQDRTQIADSFTQQFSVARPGYTVGMEFEVPLGNRAAKAKMEQRQWELKRAINSFRATVETSLTEVEISSREVDTSWRELLGKYQAMLAAQNEVSYLQDRFEVLPAVEESSMLLLEDLLDGYERLADEESAFSQAQSNYALSIILLRRTTGMLMRSRYDAPQLEPGETDYMTSRADQAATGVEARVSRTASLATEKPHSGAESAPPSRSEPVGERLQSDPPHMTAPMPHRREASPAPQAGQSLGGHSFGKGN